MKLLRKAHVPIVFTMVFVLEIFATYTVALLNGDIDPFLPYLSSAGDRPPQSCIFGMFTNICAAISFYIIYIRHRYCVSLWTNTQYIRPRILLNISKFVGYAASIGMFVVANVQETVITPVHLTAAFVSFGCGTLYMLLQTYVTYTMVGHLVSLRVARLRLVIALCSVFSFFGSIFFAWIASYVFHSVYPDLPTPRPWSKKTWQPGTDYHNISAVFEWVTAFLQCGFFLSFSPEFEDLEVELYVYHHDSEQLTHLLRSERDENPYGW